ncbi:MAG: hypothetical protein K0S45_3537 [Nitrospira sp.]|nr:hypothetical protein [Nitrospira sp.]
MRPGAGTADKSPRPPHAPEKPRLSCVSYLGSRCKIFQDIRRLRTFGPLHDVELDVFTFFQGLESVPLEGGIVDKDIIPAIELDEPKSFTIIEPFYCPFGLHTVLLS